MKRGFLNTKKGKESIARDEDQKPPVENSDPDVPMADATTEKPASQPEATTSDAPSTAHVHSEECSCMAQAEAEGTLIPIDLHAPPPGMRGNRGQERFVFRRWPRDQKGKPIPGNMHPRGKNTVPWLEIWGETLYDFYMVERVPGCPGLVTLSSGSRLADAMKQFGELDTAKDEIEWAEKEGAPHQVFPYDIKNLIYDYEQKISPSQDPNADDPETRAHPILQDRLPFNLLPEKLYVHDPWNTLSIRYRDSKNKAKTWAEMTDIVREYKLNLSPEGITTRDEDYKSAKNDNTIKKWRQVQLVEAGRAVNVLLPPRRKPLFVPEAHLYIRRSDYYGEGNHSVVYKVELELPRAALIEEDVICEECFSEALAAEIEERTNAGTLFPEGAPRGEFRTEWIDAKSREAFFLKIPDGEGEASMVMRPEKIPMNLYVGPTADVSPELKWQNLAHGSLCEHLASKKEEKRETVRVVMCAKLSLEGDSHLALEARNYQKFPRRFFQHWNGYNIVYPMHDPTPACAMVPQFYGHYVPVKQDDDGYLSPIMLIEHCGKPINARELTLDERNECAALYFYLQDAGWMQCSVADRNVVMQDGPITEAPSKRSSKKRSFRLIDFGRGCKWTDQQGGGNNAIYEKEGIFKTFGLFHHDDGWD